MPSPNKLAHVVLWTRKVKEMRDWYVKVLDARVVFESPAGAFLTYDDEHHRIAVADAVAAAALATEKAGSSEGLVASGSAPEDDATPQPAGPPTHGLAHVAFTFASLADLLAQYSRLKEQSIVPAFSINHGTTTSMYYPDPDGNQIELQIDNFDTAEEGTQFMMSESFERNPVGVLVDPDVLIKRLTAGESPKELVRPTW
jgi:catechol-2,3-dioxygenase